MKGFLIRVRYILLIILFISAAAVCGYFTYYYFYKDKKLWLAFVMLGLTVFSSIIFTFLINRLLNFKRIYEVKDLKTKLNKWTNISYHASKAGDEVFNKLPVGIVLYDNMNQIIWANQHSKNIFHSNLIDTSIESISRDLLDDVILEKNEMLLNFEKFLQFGK